MCQIKLESCLAFIPVNIPKGNITKLHQAMPAKCKHKRDTTAYHRYYNMEKTYFAKWRNTDTPYWYNPVIPDLP
jgi:hypothetical protein